MIQDKACSYWEYNGPTNVLSSIIWNLSVPLNWVHQTTAWKNNSSGCLSKKIIAPLLTSSRFLPAKTLYLHRQIAILNEWKIFFHLSLHCCCYLPLQHRLSQINTFTAKSNQSANSSRKVAPSVWTTARSGANNFQKKAQICDKDGTVLIFNSRIDALNWLSDHGWEFCSSTTYVSGSGSNGDTSVSSSETWILKYCVEGFTTEQIEEVYNKFNLLEP